MRQACVGCLVTLMFVVACSSHNEELDRIARDRVWKGEKFQGAPKSWTEELRAESLADNPATMRRIIRMSAEEVGNRIGSYALSVKIGYAFNQGIRGYTQDDRIEFSQDSSGNFHVLQSTGTSEAECYKVNDALYVRYDNGPFRTKPALNQDLEPWRDLAGQAAADALELVTPFVRLGAPELTTFNGRTVYRYEITLRDSAPDSVPLPKDDASSEGDWHTRLVPTGLMGELLVDRASGVPLRLEIKVRADVRDRPVQATSLRLRIVSEFHDVATAAPIVAPSKTVAELQRIDIYRGDLGHYVEVDGLTDPQRGTQ
jgi:hypothetical protein